MGLLDKIEDKLSGNKHSNADTKHHNIERKTLDRQGQDVDAYGQPGQTSAHGVTGTGVHDPTRTHAGQAPLTGAAAGLHGVQHDSTTTGSKTHDLRHPVQAATGKGEYGQYSSGNSGLTGTGRDTYGNDSTYKTHPAEAVDPYSTKGQNAMHAAAPGTSVHDHAGRSTFDGDVDRSRQGGVTNAMTGSGHNTGHHGMGNRPGAGGGVNLENYDAIPTAGGEKVGGLDNRYNNESGHHYGRDAAVAGGAGALAHEEHNKHGHGGGLSKMLPGKHHNDTSSTDQYGGRDRLPQGTSHTDRDGYGSSGIGSGHNDHHLGRDAAIVGGAGVVGHETGRGPHAHDPTTGTAGHTSSSTHNPISNIGGSHTGSSNITSSVNPSDNHYGRDTALAGGALGASHEATKHHNNIPGQHTGTTHTGNPITGGMTQGSTVGGGLTGHHPHHKEEKDIQTRLEEIRLERRLEEIKAAGGNPNQI